MLTNHQPFRFFLRTTEEQRPLPAPALQKAFNTMVNGPVPRATSRALGIPSVGHIHGVSSSRSSGEKV